LSAVTDEEWIGIPEVGNLTRKKRRREERTYVVPDSERGQTEFENSLDPRQQQVSLFKLNTFITDSPSRLEDLRPQLMQER
jgi:pre-mRNA-processing factor 6